MVTKPARSRGKAISEALKRYWQDPANQAKRAVLSEVQKQRWTDPTYRANVITKRSVTLSRRRVEKARGGAPETPEGRDELSDLLATLRDPSDRRTQLAAAHLLLERAREKAKGT